MDNIPETIGPMKQTWLCDIIRKRFPRVEFSEVWKKTDKLTIPEYKHLLALDYTDQVKFKETLINQLSLQL